MGGVRWSMMSGKLVSLGRVCGGWWRNRPTVWLNRVYRERLTRSGRFVLIGAMATGIATGMPSQMVGTVAFSFFAALFCGSMLISVLSRLKGLRVRRIMADRCMAGQAVPVIYRVQNTGGRDALDVGAYEFSLPRRLRLVEDPQYVARLRPGQSRDFHYQLRVERRGHYVLYGPVALSAFPFAITQARRKSPQTQRVVVYPHFCPLSRISLGQGRHEQFAGVTLRHHAGQSMEFMGNREYRAGDRLRDLHSRSSARVGRPVVRQYQQEMVTRVAMWVDTFVPWVARPRLRLSGQGWDRLWESKLFIGRDEDLLEANLSLAAAVADHLSTHDYRVDLFAIGRKIETPAHGQPSVHLESIFEYLSCAQLSKQDPLGGIMDSFRQQIGRGTTVIALFAHWDELRSRWLAMLRSGGAAVKAMVLTDDPRLAARVAQEGVDTLSVNQVREGVVEL